MRASGHYLFYAVIVQGLYVLIGHHLKHEFISRSANRIARTHFFFAKYCKFDFHFSQNRCKCPGDLLCTLIKTPGTTDPEKYFRGLAACCPFRHAANHNDFFAKLIENELCRKKQTPKNPNAGFGQSQWRPVDS